MLKQETDDVEVKELTQESPQEPQTIQEIVLREIRKIGDLCSNELTEGYWKKKPINIGGGITYTEEYIKDTRKAYCNAVDFLIDVVYPLSDKDFKKLIDEEDKKTFEDTEKELKAKRILFREINKMFEREDFFTNKLYANY